MLRALEHYGPTPLYSVVLLTA